MAASGAEEGGQLIPGLPEEIVVAQLVPRLPWYTRPLCRALSKTWKAVLDTKNPEIDLRTRNFQLPLLKGLFLFCTFDKQIFIRDGSIHEPHRMNSYEIHPYWRKLPPLNDPVVPPPNNATMVASSGMVYVWSNNSWPATKDLRSVAKLDMGCADWIWKKVPVPYGYNSRAVTFNNKIYVPRISIKSSPDSQNEKKVVIVHDMMTDTCKQVETWNQDELRVLSKSACSNALVEEMYGFEEEDFATELGVVVYDAGSDSWRTQEAVPIPECRWSELAVVKLLNSDCFEPAPEIGINIVWYDHESELLSWFNSSAGNTWVDIAYNPVLEGKYLEYLQFIRGSMYGIFCDELDEDENKTKKDNDGGELQRMSIMKGRIILESGSVLWEEVHEIGFCRERYHVDSSVIQPIDWYTTMA